MKLNYRKTVLVGFAFFLISAFWQAYDAIVPLILTNHFGLPQTASGLVMSFDNIIAVVLLPIFGALSDKVSTRYGKRTPFIIFGTVAAVIAFICLTFVDNLQLARVIAADIPSHSFPDMTDEEINALIKLTWKVTAANPWPLVGFVATLLVVLLAMATFRSPAVALMPDVTVKPLRSKANAIINLMGTAGGLCVLLLGILFGTGSEENHYMKYTAYVLAVISVMLIGLTVFLTTVKERAWAAEMEDESKMLGLDEAPAAKASDEPKRSLSKSEFKSLILILASVALWYIGYNSITSKFTVYASRYLDADFNFALTVALGAATIAYIPVGIISSKLGRKKTILIGIVILASAFFSGAFVSKGTGFLMYILFAIAGIGWATINVNSFPMVVELAKGGDVGKYTGFYYTASMAAQIVAPLLSGLLYDLIGMRRVFFAFGTIFVALSFVTMFFVRHGDSNPEKQGALESLGADND